MTLPKGLLSALVLISLGGCAALDPVDIVGDAIEGLARSACDQADNCSNLCPDGSTARPPAYRCDTAELRTKP